MSITDQPALRGRRAICALAVAGAACLALLAAPPGGRAIVFLDDEAVQLPDFDSRTAVVEPTAAQLDAVSALGASATWNSFGTPQSLVKSGGFLATDVQGADAASAVQAWLAANAGLFKVASGLTVDRVIALDENDASVVILRQRFDGLVASPDGILSVGVVGTAATGFDVVSASSSVTGDDEVTGDTELSGAEAFVAAAERRRDRGLDRRGRVAWARPRAGPSSRSTGLRDTQLVRQVAFPTPVRGVVNAYDTFYTRGKPGLPPDRRRGDGRRAPARVHRAQPGRQPDVGGVPGHAEAVHARRLPVELLEQGHPRAVVLGEAPALRPHPREHLVAARLGRRRDHRSPDQSRRAATTATPRRSGAPGTATGYRPTSARRATTATRGRTSGSRRSATRRT